MHVEIAVEKKPNRVFDLVVEALEICDHYFEDIHNKLVVGGADKTLVSRLDAAVADPTKHKAIDPICKLLLMIYRCGEHQFQDSIAIVGGELFPPLLATIFLSNTNKAIYNSAIALMDRLVRNRIDLRDVPWSRSLLDLFQEIIETADLGTHGEPISFVVTWMVEGLLLQRENNKIFLMQHRSLFESIVTKFANTFRPGCKVNVPVCRFMQILAIPPLNRLVMVKSLHFLRLLFLLLHDDCVETKKIVFEILTQLSLDRVGRTRIFAFLDHKFLELATKALDNSNLCEHSLSFIGVLVVHIPGKILSNKRPNLVRDLTKQAMLGEAHSQQAAQVFVQFAKSLSINNGKGDLLDAILELCNAKDIRIRVEGTNALLFQAQSRPACSFFIVHVPEATAMLANMLQLSNEGEIRGIAAEIVASLAASPLNVKALARNTSLLNALAANATTNSEPINERAQRHAVVAILRLVVHHRSFQAVAQEDNIVQSLCEFGSTVDQAQKLKEAALRGDACLSLSMR